MAPTCRRCAAGVACAASVPFTAFDALSSAETDAAEAVDAAAVENDDADDGGQDDREAESLARADAGLYGTTRSGRRQPLPLRAVAMRCAVVDMMTRVELLQEYFNEHGNLLFFFCFFFLKHC